MSLCHHVLPYLDDQRDGAWEDSQAALRWVALSESLSSQHSSCMQTGDLTPFLSPLHSYKRTTAKVFFSRQ